MKKLVYIFLFTSILSYSQKNEDKLYFYFEFNNSNLLEKKWTSNKDKEIFKLVNNKNDSIEFISNNNVQFIKRKPRDIIVIDENFDFDFLTFLKLIENKKIIFIIKNEKKYRFIEIECVRMYEREQE